MRYFKVAVLIVAISLVVTAQTQEPKYEMGHFFIVLVNKGPKWAPEETPEIKQMKQQHVAHLLQLGKDGRLVIAGHMTGDGPLLGVGVFAVGTMQEATALASDDPMMRSGYTSIEVHPWFAAKGIMKMPDGPLKFDTYYFGLLRKGPNWSAAETADHQKLQDAHLANIRRLAALGKIVIAGPLEDNGDIRGIFVFKTASIAEARELAGTDPTIQTGHLVLEISPWMVPSGSLP